MNIPQYIMRRLNTKNDKYVKLKINLIFKGTPICLMTTININLFIIMLCIVDTKSLLFDGYKCPIYFQAYRSGQMQL